jgi:hypothetical protein
MIAIILIATLASAQQSVAQNMSGPNRLIEATQYAARAHRDLECSDENTREPIVSARTWTEKAIETARRFRTRDKIEQGQAAAFIAREEQTLSALTETQKSLDKAAVAVTKALKAARLDTAARLHADAKSLACDARFQRLGAELVVKQSEFVELVNSGDSELAGGNPSQAIATYIDAHRANADSRDVLLKIQRARAALLQKAADQRAAKKHLKSYGTGGSNGKVVLKVILMTALLGGGYLAAQQRTHQ